MLLYLLSVSVSVMVGQELSETYGFAVVVGWVVVGQEISLVLLSLSVAVW